MLYHGTARPKMVQETEPGKLKTAQEQPPLQKYSSYSVALAETRAK